MTSWLQCHTLGSTYSLAGNLLYKLTHLLLYIDTNMVVLNTRNDHSNDDNMSLPPLSTSLGENWSHANQVIYSLLTVQHVPSDTKIQFTLEA